LKAKDWQRERKAERRRLRTMPYREYLKTEEWQVTRRWVLLRFENKCADCGDEARLQIHHLTYEFRGNELAKHLDTLIALCPACHGRRHNLPVSARANIR